MQIGINCFEDVEIRSIIASGGRVGNCDVTGQRDVLIYAIDLEKHKNKTVIPV